MKKNSTLNTILNYWQKIGMWFILIVLMLVFAFASKAFLTLNNMQNILRQVACLGVAAMGVSFVMISGSTDLSVGAVIALTMVFMDKMMGHEEGMLQMNMWLVMLIGIAIAIVLSSVNGILSIVLKIPAFAITLATMNIYQGIAFLITKGRSIGGLPEEMRFFAQKYIFGVIPAMGFVLIIFALIGMFVLGRTYFGRYVYAIGGNKSAARLSGIDVDKTILFTHVVSGAFYGIAAILLLSRTMSANGSTASNYSFECLTAACLGGISLKGGTGKVWGAILGVLVIGVLTNGLAILGVNDYVQQCIKGLLLLFALSIDLLQKSVQKV